MEEMGRQRHLPLEARNRLHCIEVKPSPEGSEDEDAVPNENIKGLAAPLLDLIRAEGESKVGDDVRSTPSLIIYDVRVSPSCFLGRSTEMCLQVFCNSVPLTVRQLVAKYDVPYVPSLHFCAVWTMHLVR